jgi:O-antigen/teichoic acid export membrane protein
MDLRALAKSSALYTIGNIATRTVGFLMIPVYTRFLTTSDYGLIELIDLVANVAAITFGIQAISSSLIRIYHDRSDALWQASVVSSAVMLMGGVAGGVGLLGILAAPWVAPALLKTTGYTALLQATFASLVLDTIQDVCLTYLRIQDRAVRYVVFCLSNLVLTLSLNIVLIVFCGFGVWGFVLSKLIAYSLGAAFLLVTTLRQVGFHWNGDAVRRMMGFGSPLVIGGIAAFAVHFLDRFILNRYASLGAVGIYSLAAKFGFLMTYLVGEPFGRVWNARLYAHTTEAEWKEKFTQVFCVLLFLLMFVWTGLSSLVDEALTVMAAPEFRGAAIFVPVIAFAYLSRTIGDFFRTLLYINKRSGLTTRIMIGCALLNTALNFALIPFHYMWGAAWASLLTWSSYMAAMWYCAQREHGLPLPYRTIAAFGVIAVALVGAARFLSAGPLGLRIATSLGIALLFPFGAWFLSFLRPSQKDTVRRLWKRPARRPAGEPRDATPVSPR